MCYQVDLVLHPLKSELNFPIGDKVDLDLTVDGERWRVPIVLLDALLYAEEKLTSVGKHRRRTDAKSTAG